MVITGFVLVPRPQKATVLSVDECGYGRDVVPLSPAIQKSETAKLSGATGLPVGLHMP